MYIDKSGDETHKSITHRSCITIEIYVECDVPFSARCFTQFNVNIVRMHSKWYKYVRMNNSTKLQLLRIYVSSKNTSQKFYGLIIEDAIC